MLRKTFQIERNVGNIQQLPETQEITPINTMFISPMEEEEEAAFAYVQDNEEEYKNDNINETPSLSLEEKERELICKALERHKGKRKDAAKELGISERTLYRKINEYQIKSR